MSGVTMQAPALLPAGWSVMSVPGAPGQQMAYRLLSNGLKATFAIETYPADAPHAPMDLPGVWKRVVISRRDRYPGWDEMRDFIRTCGLFDRTREVVMIIPPDDQYVNVHPNCFHWFQNVERFSPPAAQS